jgi:hypothetical protein
VSKELTIQQWESVSEHVLGALIDWIPPAFSISVDGGEWTVVGTDDDLLKMDVGAVALQDSVIEDLNWMAALTSLLDSVQDFIMETSGEMWPAGSSSNADVRRDGSEISVGYSSMERWILHSTITV